MDLDKTARAGDTNGVRGCYGQDTWHISIPTNATSSIDSHYLFICRPSQTLPAATQT